MLDLAIVRFIFVLVISLSAYGLGHKEYPAYPEWAWTLGGLVLGVCIIFFEVRLEKVSLKRLIGAAFGSVLGIFGAFLMGAIIPHDSGIARALIAKMEDFVVVLLLPAFFAITGLRTQISLIQGDHWAYCALIIVVAS